MFLDGAAQPASWRPSAVRVCGPAVVLSLAGVAAGVLLSLPLVTIGAAGLLLGWLLLGLLIWTGALRRGPSVRPDPDLVVQIADESDPARVDARLSSVEPFWAGLRFLLTGQATVTVDVHVAGHASYKVRERITVVGPDPRGEDQPALVDRADQATVLWGPGLADLAAPGEGRRGTAAPSARPRRATPSR